MHKRKSIKIYANHVTNLKTSIEKLMKKFLLCYQFPTFKMQQNWKINLKNAFTFTIVLKWK